MTKKKWFRMVAASCGLGLCLGANAELQAQHIIRGAPNCPPPAVIYPHHPVMPAPVVTTPDAKAAPDAKAPTTPSTTPAPTDQQPTLPPDATTGAEPSFGEGGGEAGSATAVAMQGRGDSNNRFNLFDNMAAIPQTRVWFAWQYLSQFQTGLQPSAPIDSVAMNVNNNFVRPRNVALYRLGAEVALNENFSLAVQQQYISSFATDNAANAWGNPQMLAKWAFVNTCDRALTATFGLQTQASTSEFELHEQTTRLYPGFLYYQSLGERLFAQGGAMFNISTSNLTNSFDFALAWGYWLYQHESLRMPRDCYTGCNVPFIVGIAPQIELFGKEVMANINTQPYDITTTHGTTVPYREARHVYDVTTGARVLFRNGASLGQAVSFPITGGDVRKFEYIASLNIAF